MVERFPEPVLLEKAIQEHAKAVLPTLPTRNEEQKRFRDLVEKQLSRFVELLWAQG